MHNYQKAVLVVIILIGLYSFDLAERTVINAATVTQALDDEDFRTLSYK